MLTTSAQAEDALYFNTTVKHHDARWTKLISMPKTKNNEMHHDFFISYTHVDQSWAEWIAWNLEEARYSVILQAWDFPPGSNFVLDMDQATRDAKRTIAVLSPDYFASGFTPSEWAAAFRRDPRENWGYSCLFVCGSVTLKDC